MKRAVKFITDSGCDLPEGFEKRYNIDILSFEVMLNDILYKERIDITPKEFYNLMNNSAEIPTTNQITVPRFEEKFRQYAADGVKDVIAVLINAKGSQTYFNAVKARDNLIEADVLGDTKIHVVDSRTYSIGYGYALVEAVKKIETGQSVPQVLEYLEDWFACVEVYILPLNLRHLKKSGRVTAAAAFLGELMGLRPVISLIDGVSVVEKKVRGEKAVIHEAAKLIKSRLTPETPWLAVCAEERGFYEEVTMCMSREFGYMPAFESYLGCVVSVNTGPKAVGVIVKGAHRGSIAY